jgi:hypothetical protein
MEAVSVLWQVVVLGAFQGVGWSDVIDAVCCVGRFIC